MTKTIFARLAKTAVIAIAVILPSQSFAAYTCSNPAICIAVCGAKTCGRIAANDPDMSRVDVAAPQKLSTGSTASTNASGDRAKPYTCSNPAICIAVCGKKTCG